METSLKLITLLTIFLIACNSGNNPLRQKSPEELRQELKVKEQKSYMDYLTVEYKLDKAFWSGNDIITGTINNSASIARFKDVVLTITFFTGTDTELKSADYVIYKFSEPNSKTPFEIRTNSPNATKKIGVRVNRAIPID